MLSLVLLVFIGAIVMLFSEELTEFSKKSLSFPGGFLIIPMIFLSFLVSIYALHVSFFLLVLQEGIERLATALSVFLPLGRFSRSCAHIILWVGVTFLIVWMIEKWVERKRYRTFRGFSVIRFFIFWCFILLWLATLSLS